MRVRFFLFPLSLFVFYCWSPCFALLIRFICAKFMLSVCVRVSMCLRQCVCVCEYLDFNLLCRCSCQKLLTTHPKNLCYKKRRKKTKTEQNKNNRTLKRSTFKERAACFLFNIQLQKEQEITLYLFFSL